MFLNPYYESPLHYDDPVPERNILKYDINLFDKCIYHLFDIQTLNPKPDVLDSIDTFSIKCKFSHVGWQVLEVGNRFFWVLISHFSSAYTSVGWYVGNSSVHKVFKVVIPTCKIDDAK